MYNVPNILTISRIALIPFIFLSIFFTSSSYAILALIMFIVASITDYLDGYLARAWNETSAFGRLLDPIADKLLVATALVVILAKKDFMNCPYTVIPVFVILCREILVSGLREFLREVNVGLPVTKLAKWKTAFQMIALGMMLGKDVHQNWSYLGEFLLWVAAVLTFITGYQYYQKSLDYVRSEEAKKVKVVKEVVVEAKAVTEPSKPAAVKKAATKKTAAKTSAAKKTSSKKTTAKKSTAAKKTTAKKA
ncbi:MAG: CDP-diacylglycerol--glycerol-3-phosphate 3-phosphatidyltransferase [Alphaproteobacteria bacterium]